jgi:hypothetical protein
MRARAAVVPMTPLLVRSESGLADPVADLREAAVEAVRDLAAARDRLLVLCPVGVAGAPEEYSWPSGRPGSGPLSVQVAQYLLDLAGVPREVAEMSPRSVSLGAPKGQLGRGTGLLVLGDGTARRSQAAPGHIDERSFPFDDLLADALAAGDGSELASLDQDLATELMVTGRHTFADLGRLIPAADGDLRHRDDPFGMTYFVAVWS